MQKIAVIGAGSWGTALAMLLAENGHMVNLWDIEKSIYESIKNNRVNHRYIPDLFLPETIAPCLELKDALDGVNQVLLVVPSEVFAKVLQQIKAYLPKDAGIIWATKGLTNEGEFLSNIVKKVFGSTKEKAILTGPTFAKEVARGFPTAVVLASDDLNFAKELQQVFHNPHFRTYISDDLIGAQLGGSVKNVLAIAVGISDGLYYGANARAGLITRGLVEMMRLGKVFGAKSETLNGLSGLGDLVLTCTDDQSRNRRFGLAIGGGLSFADALDQIGQVVEGYKATKIVYELAQKHNVVMPITEQMYRVLYEGVESKDAVRALLSREAKEEI